MTSVCTCPRDQLCDNCFAQQLAWYSGMAQNRGIDWASDVARRRQDLLGQPWPEHEGRAAELARSKVSDLSLDARVVERLARVVSEAAARWWAGQRGS